MIYDSVDLGWSWDGDYIINDDGDLGDTSDDYLKSVETEIVTVVKSELGDWEFDRNVGADVSDFVGLPNTLEIAEELRSRILTQLGVIGIHTSDLSIRIVPVALHAVMIHITLITQPTAVNRLGYGDKLSIAIVYDTAENSVLVVPRRPKVG